MCPQQSLPFSLLQQRWYHDGTDDVENVEMIWNDFDPNDHNVNDNVNVMAL